MKFFLVWLSVVVVWSRVVVQYCGSVDSVVVWISVDLVWIPQYNNTIYPHYHITTLSTLPQYHTTTLDHTTTTLSHTKKNFIVWIIFFIDFSNVDIYIWLNSKQNIRFFRIFRFEKIGKKVGSTALQERLFNHCSIYQFNINFHVLKN